MKATFIEGWKFFNNKKISSSMPFIFQSEFLFYIVVKKIYFFEDDESEKNMFLYDENFVLSMTKGI